MVILWSWLYGVFSRFVWWLFSCSSLPEVRLFFCVCCKFIFESKCDAASSNPPVIRILFCCLLFFYMSLWGSSLPIFVSCLSTSSSFLSEVRQREITPLWCTIAKSTESPRYYLLYPKTTPMAEVWFCFGYELYVQCSCRDTCYCLQIVRGWFQSISPHVGFASREYNTAKLSSLVSAAPGLIYLYFKRKIFVRKASLPISDGFVSLYGNSHPSSLTSTQVWSEPD